MAAPIDEASLVELRKCDKTECLFTVPNAVKDLSLILQCMTNHLMAMHPAGQSDSGGGGAGKSTAANLCSGAGKSSAAIPVLPVM